MEVITRRRIEVFASGLGLSREKVLAWAFCHAMLAPWWCIEGNSGRVERAVTKAAVFEKLPDQAPPL